MSPKHTILIVDDEAFVRNSLADLLQSEGYSTLAAGSAGEALEALKTEAVSVIVTDLSMPAEGGIALLTRIRQQGIEAPVILLTGVGTISDAVAAMKAGAFDFIQKPVEPDQFMLLMRRAIEHQDLVSEVRYLRHAVKDLRGSIEMVGSASALAAVRALIAQVAGTDATVLITGESGTGKELVAAEIHRLSRRADRNLVRVNCAAISENLFESEFFGHRRGAFTSAVSDRQGRFAEAEGGTLILDEIGTLRPEMQVKLLRVLENGEYQVVGESRTRVADVRVVAVTNEDLGARVREGGFRMDLFYRLNVFPIALPPLRQRREDIPALAECFLKRARAPRAATRAAEKHRLLSEEAYEALRAYDWPGNVRELRNVVERAAILAGSGVPDARLFTSLLGSTAPTLRTDAGADLHLRRRTEALECEIITAALARSRGKRRDAAVLLGIDPKNLAYYLKKHGIGDEVEAAET